MEQKQTGRAASHQEAHSARTDDGRVPRVRRLALSGLLLLLAVVAMCAYTLVRTDDLLSELYLQLAPNPEIQQLARDKVFMLAPGVMEVGCLPAVTSQLSLALMRDNCWSSSFRHRESTAAQLSSSQAKGARAVTVEQVLARESAGPGLPQTLGFTVTRAASGNTYYVKSTPGHPQLTDEQVHAVLETAAWLQTLESEEAAPDLDQPAHISGQWATAP